MSTLLRILITDDNPAIQGDFKKILTRNITKNANLDQLEHLLFNDTPKTDTSNLPEFEIIMASQGQEAVKLVATAIDEDNPFALAFVDIRMPPGWDGIETIQRIWEIDSDIQIVICTAYSDYSWEETIAKLGQRDNLLILKKPFDDIAVRQLSCALTKKWELAKEAHGYTCALETKIRERTQDLAESLLINRSTIESSSEGIIVVNKNNKIINYNHRFLEMWNITKEQMQSNAVDIYNNIASKIEHPTEFLDFVAKLHASSDVKKTGTLKSINSYNYFEYHSEPYRKNAQIQGRIWGFRDITNKALLELRLEHQATHDNLTDLPNRFLLVERINQAIVKAKDTNKIFAILFFDLDRFKLINDSLNHTAGDELLKKVAQRAKVFLRPNDTFARLGGDEFVVVAEDIEYKDIEGIAKTILDIFKQPFPVKDIEAMITPSIGISIGLKDGDTVDTLIRQADVAMYHAKELGGNRFSFYDKEINKKNVDRTKIEFEIRRALENNELFLVYQPQVDLTSKQIVSAEALIRWNHPTKGMVLPSQFIPIAEENGLIVPIGEWVLRTACRQNVQWQENNLPPIRMAVNVSGNQFNDPSFPEMVKNILDETGMDPKYLELELTENIIISNPSSIAGINSLKSLGILLSLDDFGTGYSSLNNLHKINIDRLKIDQSFVQNINVSRGDEVIIQAIISMAKELNLEVVAEGIEETHQLDFLAKNKGLEGQGYYFSRPILPGEFELLLDKNWKDRN